MPQHPASGPSCNPIARSLFYYGISLAVIAAAVPIAASSSDTPQAGAAASVLKRTGQARATARIIHPVVIRQGRIEDGGAADKSRLVVHRTTHPCPAPAAGSPTDCRMTIINLP